MSAQPTARSSGRFGRKGLLIAYVLAAALPLALALFGGGDEEADAPTEQVQGQPAPSPQNDDNLVYELGVKAGLLGFALLALQAVAGSRLKLTDRPFGLDRVFAFHVTMGKVTLGLLILHPILMIAGSRSLSLLGFHVAWTIWLGKGALFLLILSVVLALNFWRLKLDFLRWLTLHKAAYIVLPLGFVHSLLVGPDMASFPLQVYWVLLFLMAVGVFAWENALAPLFGGVRCAVEDVREESARTYTLTLRPIRGTLPAYAPGQFMFLKLQRPGRPSEQHPFTIASAPTQSGVLTATIRESGDFTNTIGQTKAGDRARVQAPFGRFSYFFHDAPRFVFIAGGVGITPLMSMLRHLRDTQDARPVLLLYANRSACDITFKDELARMPPTVRTVHILSKAEPGWTGEQGLVTPEFLQKHATEELKDGGVFVCGPPRMMRKVKAALQQLGVPETRVHSERFAL